MAPAALLGGGLPAPTSLVRPAVADAPGQSAAADVATPAMLAAVAVTGVSTAGSPERGVLGSHCLHEPIAQLMGTGLVPQAIEQLPVEQELIDDIVPFVSYEDRDDKRSFFSKDGRWIIPKREQFPSVFCALRVKVTLQTLDARLAKDLPKAVVDEVLREGLGFGKTLVRWDDARLGAVAPGSSREVVAALSGQLPPGREKGSTAEDPKHNVVATIVDVVETCEDGDPDRIASLAQCLQESGNSDAIVFELPQLWIIPDPDFRAKTASIGLYPGSFWMGFLKSWGPVTTAEVFFRTAPRGSSEPRVHLVVKYRDRECMKMCFTFLYDRYLVHPKQENELRPPWCHLTRFQDFRGKALNGSKGGAKSTPKGGGARSKAVGFGASAKARPPKSAGVATRPSSVAAGAAGPPAVAKALTSKAKARPASVAATPEPLAPMTPMPGRERVEFLEHEALAAALQTPSAAAAAAAAAAGASPKAVTPTTPGSAGNSAATAGGVAAAKAMHGLSGKQLEAFQMVMTRMERLERENQELMQILLQMQGLLQQQQQRNARLSQMAGFSASGIDQRPALPSSGMALGPAPPVLGGAAGAAALAPPPLRTLRVGQLARGEAASRAEKRKAGQLGPDGSLEGEAGVDDAPWKRQRKRPRRVPRASSGDGPGAGSGVPGGESPGLAAYHMALLGV